MCVVFGGKATSNCLATNKPICLVGVGCTNTSSVDGEVGAVVVEAFEAVDDVVAARTRAGLRGEGPFSNRLTSSTLRFANFPESSSC